MSDQKNENSGCCGKTEQKRGRGILTGIAYGLIPHTGCIAFIVGSILGVTVLTQLFKPLLMNPYFFHILILISLGFATLSSVLYLRKNGFLSLTGTKRKWKYLSTMYGSTIVVNLLLFMIIFPLLANVSSAQPITGNFAGVPGNENSGSDSINTLSSIRLQVDIPCPGHAPLISEELKTINGVFDVQFSFPNIFDVKYDPTKTSKQQMLSLEVFKTYKATVLDESTAQIAQQNIQQLNNQLNSQSNITGGGCCGSGGCAGAINGTGGAGCGGGGYGGSGGGCGCGRR
jgi:copper chaperone CopZ